MPPGCRRAVIALLVLSATVYGALGLARYQSFHNQTFDLALYARLAWGLSRGDFWDPILGANILGLHLSPVLAPLGLLARLGDPAATLIVGQAIFLGLAGWPLARIGARRLGTPGAILGALSLLLYPNLVHVAAYEVHPGTLAVLPLAWALDAADRRSARSFIVASLAVLSCREDLALYVALLAVVTPWSPAKRRQAWSMAFVALAWFALFLFVLAPRYAPAVNSFAAHFGRWGASPSEVLGAWATHPLDLAHHLLLPRRLSYLPRLLLPLTLLPLLSPRWLIPALPALAINLLSDFPTTTNLDSHYLSPIVPFLVVAALDGLWRLSRRVRFRRVWVVLGLPLAIAHVWLGGSPLALDFEPERFRADADSGDAALVLEAIPADVSVQAPDALLPHLAARRLLFRAADPDHGARFIVLSLRHRRRFAHQETLLRTVEEPLVRDWLAKDDVAVRVATAAYLLLERGAAPRESAVLVDARLGGPLPTGPRITSCLELSEALAEGNELELHWRAHGPCPSDLALRVDVCEPPTRVDLLLGGRFSPAHLSAGDLFRTRHLFERGVPARVFVGALRQSGARSDSGDPPYAPVSVTQGSLSAP